MEANEATAVERRSAGATAGQHPERFPYRAGPAFVGRELALRELVDAADHALRTSTPSFVAVIGEPGMGKSRLLAELAGALGELSPTPRMIVCPGGDRSQPLFAFSRLFGVRFGIASTHSLEQVQDRIVAGVSGVLPEAQVTEVSHLIAHLMRAPFPHSPVIGTLGESATQLESRMFIAIRRLLAADASHQPLILAFEDLERSAPETINLIHYLAAGLAGSPALVIGTARASVYDHHPSFGTGQAPARRIFLGPLEVTDAENLLRELCEPLDSLPEELIAHVGKLGGSPRAVFELVRLLVERGLVVGSPSGGWAIDADRLAQTGLPASHEELINERVALIAPGDHDILEKAAAAGESCWLESIVCLVRAETQVWEDEVEDRCDDPDGPTLAEIAAAGDHTRVQVSRALARLAAGEWICELDASTLSGEREFRFAYPHLWSHVYAGTDPVQRQRYHQLIAQWLELRPEGRGYSAQEDVARHLELSGDRRGAAGRYRRAAHDARARFLNDRAIRLYMQALDCLGDADAAERIHLWHDLGSVYELCGNYPAALGAFERMLRLAWVCASRTKAAVAFNKMGRVWRHKGDLSLALEYLQRGLELFEQAGDARGIAGSLDDIGTTLHLLGRYDEAFESVTRGLSRRGSRKDKRSIAQSLSTLGNIQRDRGRFAEAFNCHREALAMRREVGDRVGVITSLSHLAALSLDRGELGRARQDWEQALSESEDIGALPLQALALCHLGRLALVESRHDEARRRLEDSLRIAEGIDDRQLQSDATRTLALLEHACGHIDRAREFARTALDVAAAAGLKDSEGRALLALAEVTGGALFDASEPASRDDELPRDYFERGLELLRAIGNESELARGLERYGRYKIERGDVVGGRAMLEQALDIFTRLGMTRRDDVRRVLAGV